MLDKITNALKHQAKNKVNESVNIATNEVKKQYSFIKFMAKFYIITVAALITLSTLAVGYGLYRLVTN